MDLYHYTFFKALMKADPNNVRLEDGPVEWAWSSGLKPGPDSMAGWSDRNFNPPPAVWFTTTPTPDGIVMLANDGEQRKFDLRITVAIGPQQQTPRALGKLLEEASRRGVVKPMVPEPIVP
jgi:hypothetical protein